MNSKTRFALSPLALAMITLSAHTGSTRFRTDFNADGNLLGVNYIEEGGEEGGGDKTAVDTSTSVVGTGASTDQAQQDQSANAGTPQADGTDAVGDPPAGSDQQQAEGAAPQANAEPETAAGTDQVQ